VRQLNVASALFKYDSDYNSKTNVSKTSNPAGGVMDNLKQAGEAIKEGAKNLFGANASKSDALDSETRYAPDTSYGAKSNDSAFSSSWTDKDPSLMKDKSSKSDWKADAQYAAEKTGIKLSEAKDAVKNKASEWATDAGFGNSKAENLMNEAKDAVKNKAYEFASDTKYAAKKTNLDSTDDISSTIYQVAKNAGEKVGEVVDKLKDKVASDPKLQDWAKEAKDMADKAGSKFSETKDEVKKQASEWASDAKSAAKKTGLDLSSGPGIAPGSKLVGTDDKIQEHGWVGSSDRSSTWGKDPSHSPYKNDAPINNNMQSSSMKDSSSIDKGFGSTQSDTSKSEFGSSSTKYKDDTTKEFGSSQQDSKFDKKGGESIKKQPSGNRAGTF